MIVKFVTIEGSVGTSKAALGMINLKRKASTNSEENSVKRIVKKNTFVTKITHNCRRRRRYEKSEWDGEADDPMTNIL